MRLRLGLVLFAFSGLVVGCRCGGDATVPFHAGGDPALRPVDPAASLAPLEAAIHPDGTRVLELDGARLAIDAGAIRASGIFDFDRDGDRDAILVVLGDPGAAMRLLYGERRGADWAPLLPLASRVSFALTGGGAEVACTPEGASVTPLSDALVVVSVESRCDATDAPRLSSTWALTADERPRALESFELAGRAEGEGLSFAAVDRDHDDHDDLEVEVRVATPTQPATTTLVWMSRAAGLSREGDQPEPTLATLSTQARDFVRRNPDEAIVAAERAIALRDALCREAERPRFLLGATRGIPCGTSASIGRAYAMRAAALARRIDPAELDDDALRIALEAYLRLDHHGAAIREGDRALVRDSWMRLSSVPPRQLVVHRSDATVGAPTQRTPRLSSLAFLDEDRLLVRGPEPRVLRVVAGALVPDARVATADEGDMRVLDPDRARELVAIERTCEGTVVVIAPASGIVDAITGDRREILLAARPAPALASCPTMPEGHRRDDDALVALGWAPSGIVLARGAAITVVPLDASGAPDGAPRVLSSTAAAPAPLPPGASVADVRGHAYALPIGIVVIDRVGSRVQVFHDEDFAVPRGASIDVALSPDLSRAAWLCGDHVCWADLRASGAPVEPAVDHGTPPVMPAEMLVEQPQGPSTPSPPEPVPTPEATAQ